MNNDQFKWVKTSDERPRLHVEILAFCKGKFIIDDTSIEAGYLICVLDDPETWFVKCNASYHHMKLFPFQFDDFTYWSYIPHPFSRCYE